MNRLIKTGIGLSDSSAGPVYALSVAPLSENSVFEITSVNLVWMACATVGTRNIKAALIDGSSNKVSQVSWVPTVAAGQTRTFTAGKMTAVAAAFVQNAAQTALPEMKVPYPYSLAPYDDSAIAANNDLGVSTAVTATTLTDTLKSWTVNAWTGYTVLMGSDVTMVVTSNTDTVLTGTGGWSDLVAGTAEDSDATSMTDSDASWSTNTWTGFTVAMGGSTGTILSNTATVLTIGAWDPVSPTTGAYTITGSYTLYGDTGTFVVAYDQLEVVSS